MSRIVAIPGHPGESIDSRLMFDVVGISRRYKVKITDGYATSGHAAGGEHPKGLAIDVVPDTARGGTWDDVDRLVADAERQKGPGKIFRWIGYNGVRGHGRGHHAHLSWNADAKPFVATEKGEPFLPSVATGVRSGALDLLGLGADKAGDAASAALNPAKALVDGLSGVVKQEGAKAMLYLVLVLGGTALAMIGLARSVGVDAAPAAAKGAT